MHTAERGDNVVGVVVHEFIGTDLMGLVLDERAHGR